MLKWYRRYRRERLLAQSFPDEWVAILVRNVAHYRLLNDNEQARLRNDARILVAEKYWVGCRGLQITDEIKVTIAGQASLLLLGMEHDFFSRSLTVLVYPSAFTIPQDECEAEIKEEEPTCGEAVYRGPVVLSWDTVLAEGQDPSAGENLVIHEFAHQLDFQDGYVNGTPELGNVEEADRWREVMTAEYAHLKSELRRNRATLLDEYAARNEAEFFAVASELFFTRPVQLRHLHARLYQVLADYYRLEPARWFTRADNAGRWSNEPR